MPKYRDFTVTGLAPATRVGVAGEYTTKAVTREHDEPLTPLALANRCSGMALEYERLGWRDVEVSAGEVYEDE